MCPHDHDVSNDVGHLDSDITIRRKIAFLINALLLPTAPAASSSAAPNISPPGPTIHSDPLPSTAPSTVIAPHSESEPLSSATPLSPGLDPMSTSLLALEALRSHRIIPVLISSLTIPLPHGPNADEDVDVDYAEKAARALFTFIEACSRLFHPKRFTNVLCFNFFLDRWRVEFS